MDGDVWVAGVDGCHGGWLVALLRLRQHNRAPAGIRFHLCPRVADILALEERPAVIAVDMPVGLLDFPAPGGRGCDRAARRLLGRRASSVFPPPTRPALAATGYRQAIALNRRGLSRQAYNILPKIRELDDMMTPALQETVFEAHPELAFRELAGHALRFNKKSESGQTERSRLLRKALGELVPDPAAVRGQLGRRHLATDDILDACAVALTARRIFAGEAGRLPGPEPERDGKGLRMEIWF